MQERATEIETRLLFFELEWAAVDDARADELLAADGLEFARHYLRSARRYRPHLLTEPEEKILAEKSIASQGAWSRLFGELVSALRVALDGEQQALDIAPPASSIPTATPPQRGRGRVRGARARPAHPGVHLQHARPG